jgi:hypothetical protein
MSASICKLAIEGFGPPQLRIARHVHPLPRGIVLRPLAGAAHQVGASTRSTHPLSPNMTMKLNALLLTSRLHNRSGPQQRMKYQWNNLWFRCCPNNCTRHKLRVNLPQTNNDRWKRKCVSWKHVSVSINIASKKNETLETETCFRETCFRFYGRGGKGRRKRKKRRRKEEGGD